MKKREQQKQQHSFSDVRELSDEDLLMITGGSHHDSAADQVMQYTQQRITNGGQVQYADTSASTSRGTEKTHADIVWKS